MKRAWSWGNYPLAEHEVKTLQWRNDAINFAAPTTFLPYGFGRSYGDVPLNDGGTSLHARGLNRIISFDPSQGILHCEAGMSLKEILAFVVPLGWFLPVTPGTQYVTAGGAVANDVHGKNHHGAGTFGCHVHGFELLRSTGEVFWCSSTENTPLFCATVGGLGLTGLILSVQIQLIPITSSGVDTQTKIFDHLEEGLELFEQHHESTYSVAWVDCLSQGDQLGRGIFSLGEHSMDYSKKSTKGEKLAVPFNFPSFTLNKWSVKAFNEVYFRNGKRTSGKSTIHYAPFFYPLDGIKQWNKIYGGKGFFQHQCVVPFGQDGEGKKAIRELLNRISASGNASFLAVLKTFGKHASPGLLSFPMEGITLALDFPNKGPSTLTLLNELDTIVHAHGGRIYPAKDARMAAQDFQTHYPNWEAFCQQMDPKFSSSFWRRVTNQPTKADQP